MTWLWLFVACAATPEPPGACDAIAAMGVCEEHATVKAAAGACPALGGAATAGVCPPGAVTTCDRGAVRRHYFDRGGLEWDATRAKSHCERVLGGSPNTTDPALPPLTD